VLLSVLVFDDLWLHFGFWAAALVGTTCVVSRPRQTKRLHFPMLKAMKRPVAVMLLALGALAASATLAWAHGTAHSWTVTKARVMLQEGTNVALTADQRAAAGAEIDAWLTKLRPLLLTAQALYESTQNPEYARLGQTYDSTIDRFEKAKATLAAGLSIDSTKCGGQGKAIVGKFTEKAGGAVERRYKHFRCNATSYALEIPNIELVPGAVPSAPEVVEGQRRLIGPLQAVFTVHVTGKSRMLAQRGS
jgi:hypothetical protein